MTRAPSRRLRKPATWTVLLVLGLAPGLLARAEAHPAVQDPGATRDAQGSLERMRAYLRRSPYHERVFDGLVDAALAQGILESLVAEYRQAVLQAPAHDADRIVLARLLARGDAVDEARRTLARLGPTQDDEERTRREVLDAELARAEGELDAAAAALGRAALATADDDFRKGILEDLARTQLDRGERGLARAAFLRLAELEPESYSARKGVADLMADCGLEEAALEHYAAAAELAGGDAQRKAQALFALGRVLESLQRGVEALEVYAETRRLTARDNWLSRDTEQRVLDLHATGGTLEELIEVRTREAREAPADIALREDLARVLTRAGRHEEALELLRAATLDFPSDPGLSRDLRAAARALGRPGEALKELQRLADTVPSNAELAFEVAAALLAAGRVEQARERFARLASPTRPDPGFLRRVASTWADHGHTDEALRVHEAAIAAAPLAARGYTELARMHFELGDSAAALAVLARAEESIAGATDGLRDVADLYRRLGDRRGAARLYARALELAPRSPQLVSRLAELELALGERDAAREHLRLLIDVAGDGTLRTAAVDRYVAMAGSKEERESWIVAERAALERDPDQRAPYLLLHGFHAQRGMNAESDAASRMLELYLTRWPEDLEARRRFADRLVLLGRTHRALKHYNILIQKEPQLRASFLLAKASIYMTQGHETRAVATLSAARRESSRSAELLRRIAGSYLGLARPDLAIESLEQALRVRPDDARAAYALAELHMGRGKPRVVGGARKPRSPLSDTARTRAIESLLVTYRAGDAKLRKRAASDLRRLYAQRDELASVLADLERRVRDNPYDRSAPPLLVDLLMLEQSHERAHRIVLEQLERRPNDPRLLSQRASVLVRRSRYDESLRDVRRLVELGVNVDSEVLDLLPFFVRTERTEEVMEMGGWVSDPLPVSRGLLRAGMFREAVTYLRTWADGAGLEDEGVIELLAAHHRYMEDPEFAIEVLEARERLAGPTVETTKQLGQLYNERGRVDAVLDCGRRLLALDADEREVGAFFESMGLRAELTRLRTERVLGGGLDFATIDATLERFLGQRYDAPGALEMIETLRRRLENEDARPPELGRAAWRAYLQSFELALYRRNSRLVQPRIEALEAARDSDAGDAALEAWEWSLLLRLIVMPGAAGGRSMWRVGQAAGAGLDPRLADAALARYPDDALVLTSVALLFEGLDRRPRAAESYERLLEVLRDGSGREVARWLADDHRRARERALASFTIQAERSDPSHLGRLLRLTFPESPADTPRPRAVLSEPAIQRRLAFCLARTGDAARARSLVRASEPLPGDDLHSWFEVAEAYLKCGFRDEAHDVLGRLWRLRAELLADDDVAGARHLWEAAFRQRFGYLSSTSIVTLWWGLG